MNTVFVYGFLDRLTKLALDEESARKMTEAIKPYLVRRGFNIEKLLRGRFAFARRGAENIGPTTVAPITHASIKKAVRDTGLSAKEIKRRTKSLAKIVQNITRGRTRIFAQGSYMPRQFGMMLDDLKLGPKQKEMANRLMLGHEGSEIRYMNRDSPAFRNRFVHNSPAVIVEESSMLGSLPKEYEPVKNLYREIRGTSGEARAMEKAVRGVGNKPGFVYGKRYSRHARRRIAEIVERKMREQLGRQ